jgi:hypothetical protein
VGTKGSAVENLRALAAKMDDIVDELHHLELKSAELSHYAALYGAMASDVSAAARDLADAVDEVDMGRLSEAAPARWRRRSRAGCPSRGAMDVLRAPSLRRGPSIADGSELVDTRTDDLLELRFIAVQEGIPILLAESLLYERTVELEADLALAVCALHDSLGRPLAEEDHGNGALAPLRFPTASREHPAEVPLPSTAGERPAGRLQLRLGLGKRRLVGNARGLRVGHLGRYFSHLASGKQLPHLGAADQPEGRGGQREGSRSADETNEN